LLYRLLAVAAAAIVLEGCATKPPEVGPSVDLNVGIAKTCTFTPVQPAPGSNVSSAITMTNDGWCAVRTTEADGQPFLLGLVRQRPAHGTMLVQKLGGETRLEYTPNPGYTGTDSFTAALRPKAAGAPDAAVQVAVTVTRGAGVPAVAPAEEHKPTTPSRTRRPARRSSSSNSR
jgi:hypothetical protein